MNKLTQLKELYTRLDACVDSAEVNQILAEFEAFCSSFTDAEKAAYQDEIAKFVRRRLDAVIEESRIEKHRMAVEFDGRRYESPEWLTVSAYARLHGATTQKIFNWIKRGNISPEDFVEIPDLNSLKLIRNKTYELRKYQLIGSPSGT